MRSVFGLRMASDHSATSRLPRRTPPKLTAQKRRPLLNPLQALRQKRQRQLCKTVTSARVEEGDRVIAEYCKLDEIRSRGMAGTATTMTKSVGAMEAPLALGPDHTSTGCAKDADKALLIPKPSIQAISPEDLAAIRATLETLRMRPIADAKDDAYPFPSAGQVMRDVHISWRDGLRDDQRVPLIYYALTCDFQFTPRFKTVGGGPEDAGSDRQFGGISLVDPEANVTAWRESRDELWRNVKVRACRLSLKEWRRKVGWWWPLPGPPQGTSVAGSGAPARFAVRFADLLSEYVQRFGFGKEVQCTPTRCDEGFKCVFEIQGFLEYSSGRTYATKDEAVENEAYDLFFALSTNNSNGIISLSDEKTRDQTAQEDEQRDRAEQDKGALAPEQREDCEDDDSDYIEIICDRPGQNMPYCDGWRRKGRNWSRRFDHAQTDTLKRKRNSDQWAAASKRVRTNDGNKLEKRDPAGRDACSLLLTHDQTGEAASCSQSSQYGRSQGAKTPGQLANGHGHQNNGHDRNSVVPGLPLSPVDRKPNRQAIGTTFVNRGTVRVKEKVRRERLQPITVHLPNDSNHRNVPQRLDRFRVPQKTFDLRVPLSLGREQDNVAGYNTTAEPNPTTVQELAQRHAWKLPSPSHAIFQPEQRSLPSDAEIILMNLMSQYNAILADCLTNAYRLERFCCLLRLPPPVYQYYRVLETGDHAPLSSHHYDSQSGGAARALIRAGVFFMDIPVLMAGNPWGLAATPPSSTFKEAKELCAAAVVWDLMRIMQSGVTSGAN